MASLPTLRPSGAVDLLEAVHTADDDWQRWTLRVADGASRFFAGDAPYATTTFRTTDESVELVGHAQVGALSDGSAVGDEMLLMTPGGPARFDTPLSPLLVEQFRNFDPRWTKVFYRHGRHLAWHSELVKTLPPGVIDFNGPFFEANGVTDALAVSGSFGGHTLGIVRMFARKPKLQPRIKQSLMQIALHMESSLRLRLQPDAVVAIIRPDGRVAHAEKSAAEKVELRSLLARHARQIEHARLRRVRTEPDATDTWTALVGGRWGLLEQTDSDGSRHYVAIENAPEAQRLRALSRTEVEVLKLYAHGLSGKMVGYGLGLTAATVSAALGSAGLKLGVRNRAAVIRLAAHLSGSTRAVAPTRPLTEAEAEVLGHLRQGLTNAQIARRRGSAERTVANQVAAILHKLQLPSRSAVAVLGV
jgi:DNA-binding NarL/FixJ family response regulator